MLRTILVPALFLLFVTCSLRAADEAALGKAMLDLNSEEFAGKKAAIDLIAGAGDMRMIAFLEEYSRGSVYIWNGKIVVSKETKSGPDGTKLGVLLDPFNLKPISENSAEAAVPMSALKAVDAGRRERNLVKDALAMLKLLDPNRDARLSAVIKCGDSGSESNLPVLKKLLDAEKDPKVRLAIQEGIFLLTLIDPASKPDERQTAIVKLGEVRSGRGLSKLKEMQAAEKDSAAKKALDTSIASIEQWQAITRGAGYIFSGISLGSILVLMALGLSIIFGLMGVINMAHGELMMIGAYATFVVQKAFEAWFPPSAFNYYFIVAIPVSFIVAAFVGYLIELLVIRHLYGRPLETLLATFGVSYILTQLVRLNFGDNIAVNSPTWLQGGAEVVQDLVLPYNRCFIIVFCGLCISMMYLIMGKTKLGLLLRATTQNRNMAASLGVPTRRIDGYTFALGAGLAGLAGCALTQIGGVTPDMGQNYIVDSFMVVVTGGVGKLAGAIWAGLALGCLNKGFEPIFEAVWAKVLILVCVVLFIQWRPSGLFPAKGRLADV